MTVPGERLATTIWDIGRRGRMAVRQRRQGTCDRFDLAGGPCRVEVAVDPQRWIGMSFRLLDARGRTRISHGVDTDLYELTRPGGAGLAEGTEDEIVGFLTALVGGQVRVGRVHRGLALIRPDGDGYQRVCRGRLLTSGRFFADLAAAEADGTFEPLSW
jgi:hypothetical protein